MRYVTTPRVRAAHTETGVALAIAGAAATASDESTCCDWLGTWCPWNDCDEARAQEWAEDVAEEEGSAQVVVERGTDGEFYVTSEVAPDGTVTELDPIQLTDRANTSPPSPSPTTEPAPTTSTPPPPTYTPSPNTFAAPSRPAPRWIWPAVIGGAGVVLLGVALFSRRRS